MLIAADPIQTSFGGTQVDVAIAPPDGGPGAWAGAPSALLVGGTFYLAYRVRLPIGKGRGIANVVARSTDGVVFETVAELDKDTFGAESLERPALAVTAAGSWRVYVSCATPGTKHWRVDLLEADTPEGLSSAPTRTVLPGSPGQGVKDPVIVAEGGQWHMWASVHPLGEIDHTDRMTSDYATSPDGVEWTWHGTALAPRPGSWDARGTRITAVDLSGPTPVAWYDGRATAEENWEERTGVARGGSHLGEFMAFDDEPVAESAYGLKGLRYLSIVPLPGGGRRLYYERTRADGAHELVTELVPAA